MVHSRVDEDLQRIEEATAPSAGARKQEVRSASKCEGKRYNGTYLSLVAAAHRTKILTESYYASSEALGGARPTAPGEDAGNRGPSFTLPVDVELQRTSEV